MRAQLPKGRYTIQQVTLDNVATTANDKVREFEITSSFWEILPANRRFDVIHCNNRAAALRLGNQTYLAEFSTSSEGIVVIQLRRENCKQVYRFDLKLVASLVDAV